MNEGGRFRDVSATAGRGLAVQKCSRAVAVGDLDNDGDPDLVVSAMDEEPTLLENTQRSGNHWLGRRAEADGAPTPSPSGRGSPSEAPAAASRSARSAPAAATSRRTTCAPCSGSVASAGPVTVEVRLGRETLALGRRRRRTATSPSILDDEHRVEP